MQIGQTREGTIEYDSDRRGPVAWEQLRDLWAYRDLIYQLVRRDVVSRYKRSALGIAWTMLNPLGMMLILALVFSQVFHAVADYPAYLLSGLIAWNFFTQATASAMNQSVWGGSLLHRIYLPRSSFIVSAIITGVVNLLLALVPLLLVMLLMRMPLHWSILFLPVPILLLAVFAMGIGLLFSAWAIYFPDLTEMYQVGVVAWMYLTPVLYPVEIIPQAYRFWLLHLNPMYYLVEIFRQPVYAGVLPSGSMLCAGAAVAFAALVLGWLVFSLRADEFTYRT
jgi:ABC-type polysaccharide/polyol phosphate export permease